MRRRGRILRLAAVGLLLQATTGCQGGVGSGDEPVSAVGTWGRDGAGQPQLVLEEDGRLHGTDGCNRLMGSWQEDDRQIVFGEVATTMMYCEGVDTWLSGLSTATIDRSTMHIADRAGNEIGTLERTA